ncbi:YuzL family protein [Bacillus sp. RG28]|uniref:YuzL family protein n=1 Tax=Gottfriedia endophytica TaxID=2820819 RepID=A0A940NNZ0_9BACI|nr:YuzL family protein [Gottfriedia endophytica]MBP0725654.1 YuzL family protein [Gottfriedia endophytica]
MLKREKNPSSAAVSAASMQGNADPGAANRQKKGRHGSNEQYGKENMGK